ncbi:MAG: DegV family protein [Anaerolineaceae bacterium]|nr:DegV family protein [Anaerolineaceae bacterium]
MVIIATDSAADFELDELKEMNISCLPMSVSFGENTYLENISITKEEFFERIEVDKNFPKTSQPSPAYFEKLFLDAKENNDEVVYIPLSSGISGDYQTAVMVKNLVNYDRIWLVDSLTCTGGQRLLVEEAVRMRNAGMDGKTIFDALEELKKRAAIYTIMDTLEYLVKNGRLSGRIYRIAKIGHIKPVMHCSLGTNGKPIIISKHIGMRKAISYVVGRLFSEPPDPNHPIYVMYSYDRENAVRLAESIRQAGFTIEERQIVPVGATVGAHVGRNACAITYIKKN